MLNFLPAPLLGMLSGGLIILNTFIWFLILIPQILLKVIVFIPSSRRFFTKTLTYCAERWVYLNSGILYITQKTVWEVEGLDGLDPGASYLVLSNHQSWMDIFVLQHVLKGHIPFLKFFIKKELIWVPMLGIAWWALDMPFMKRYSREVLEKHPELRGKDMETTRKSCEKFKYHPASVINFLEGTRFRPQKHQRQKSPYRYLLRPKAGGIALALSVMGDVLDKVVDVTVAYPDSPSEKLFWGLLSGKVSRVVVRVTQRDLPADTQGKNYLEDAEYRQQIQDWVNQVWQDKDRVLQAILSDSQDSNEPKTVSKVVSESP